MPRSGFNFDGDNAYYESLRTKVLQDEADRKAVKEEAERERRRSLGLPEEEHKSWSDRRKAKSEEKKAHPERKKSVGEKIANVMLNGGRSEKVQTWAENHK